MTEDDAATLAVAMLEHPSVRRWWGTPGTREERVEELLNEGRAFAIEVDGELAGWIGYEEELEPDYKHAGLFSMVFCTWAAGEIGSQPVTKSVDAWL